jgi:hypothetical protein
MPVWKPVCEEASGLLERTPGSTTRPPVESAPLSPQTFDEALAQGVARAGDPFVDSGLPPDDAEVTGSPRASAGMHGDSVAGSRARRSRAFAQHARGAGSQDVR